MLQKRIQIGKEMSFLPLFPINLKHMRLLICLRHLIFNIFFSIKVSLKNNDIKILYNDGVNRN